MDIPDLPGGLVPWCMAALFAWLVIVVAGWLFRRATPPLYPLLHGCASLLILLIAFASPDATLTCPLPWFVGDAALSFTVDPLSRWFLATIGLIGLPLALFTPGYLKHLDARVAPGGVWAGMALLFISMVGVVLAANAILFLVMWEIMAIASFVLVATDHTQHSTRRAAFVYLGATRAGTAFLMAGFLWAHHLTGSWAFSAWHLHGVTAFAPALLILIGLLTKAGSWPFHLWLPMAHPAAPAPVSAVMSGVMLKTAIYALLRLFVCGDHLVASHLGSILLILGAISAFWGVLFALLQQDLKRLLAYSSVENIGMILMGAGLSLYGQAHGIALIAHLGLMAALWHTLNHAVFKSLLFLASGVIDAQAHTREIDRLGGLLHRLPWTGAAVLVGAAAICALPPFNGFVSEYVLYQGFFNLALHGASATERLVGLLLIGWLALIGALALACFAKVVGVVLLGVPRSPQAAHAREASGGMVWAQGVLAVLCIGLGVAAGAMVPPLRQVTAMLGLPVPVLRAEVLPLPLITIVLLVTVSAITLGVVALARHRPVVSFLTWECGFGPLGARMQYSGTSFTQPIARLFGALYRYVLHIVIPQSAMQRLFPQHIQANLLHEPYLETRVYRPLVLNVQRIAGAFIMRMQAGSIHQYLLYMLLVLALLLWVGFDQ